MPSRMLLLNLGFKSLIFFSQVFFLIIEVSDKSKEISALIFYEVKVILKCLTVEENSNSIVMNTFKFDGEIF